MNSAVLPEFILKIIEAELHRELDEILDKVCNKFKIDNDAVKEYVGKQMYTPIDVETDTSYKIVKTKARRIIPLKDRCIARYYCKKEKDICQCPRAAKNNEFCMTHYNLWLEDYLRFGTIKEPKGDNDINYGVIKKSERQTRRKIMVKS